MHPTDGPKLTPDPGNLPFDATKASIEEHFCKIQPSSIRLIQDKATGKGKGIAFVEFPEWDRLQTAIKLYHHTPFSMDEGKTSRKINVELT